MCALVLPLVLVLPGGLFPYELPKLVGCGIAIPLAALAASRGGLPRAVVVLIAGSAVVLLAAALLSADPLLALIGRWPRYQGLVALPLYAGMLWAGARLLGPGVPRRQADVFLSAVSVALLLIASVAVVEAAGLRPIAGDAADRTGALLGTATDEGLVGAMATVLLLGSLLQARRRPVLQVAGLLAGGLLVVLAASRGGYLALGVGIVLLTVRLLLQRCWAAATWGAGAGAVAVVAGLLVPTTAARLVGATALARATATNRELLWGETVQLILHSGPFGVGASGFVQAVLPFQTVEWGRKVGFGAPVDSPHSVLLQAFAAGGPLIALAGLGLAAFVLVLGLHGDPFRAPFAAAALAGVGGLLSTFPTSGTAPLLLVLTGGAVASPASARRAVRVGWGAIAAVLALVALSGAAAEVPLRGARDAAQRGDLPAFTALAASAHVLRPWDFEVGSIAAQTAVEAAQRGEGRAFLRIGITEADAALALAPSDHDTLAALAVARQLQGDDRAALQLWDRLIAQSPADDGLLVHRLVSRAHVGDMAGAVADGRRALQLNPRNTTAAHDLALLIGPAR